MTTIAEYLAEQNTQQAEAYPSPGGDTAVAEMPDSLREYLRETRQSAPAITPAPKAADSYEPAPPDPYKARQKDVADRLAIESFPTALEAAAADPRFTMKEGTNWVNLAAEWAATVSTPVTAPGQTDLEAHAASVAQFRKQFGGTPEDVLQQRQDRQAAAPENNMRIEAMGRALDRIGSPAWNAMGDQDRIDLIKQELDDPSLMNMRDVIEAHSDAGVNYKKLLPFFGGAYEAKELALLVQAALAIDDGTATPSQIDAIVHFSDAAEIARLRGNSILAGATDIASVLPGMMIEFAATSGLYTLGAKLTEKGLKIILKRVLKKTIKNRAAVIAGKVAFKTTTMAGGSLVRGLGLPQLTIKNAMQRMLYDKETFFWAMVKAPFDTWIELFTEQTGESIHIVGKLVGKTKLISALQKGIKAWGKRHNILPRDSTTKFLKAFADRTGYHGPIPEIGEEELGKILRAIILGDPYAITGLRELASQGIAFSLLSGSGIALAGGDLLGSRIGEARKANQESKRGQGGPPQAEAPAEAPAEASKKVKPPRTSSLAAWVADAEGAEHDPAFVAAIKAKIAKEPDNEYGILKEANASYEVFVQLKEHADVTITVTPEGEIKLQIVPKAKPVADQSAVSPVVEPSRIGDSTGEVTESQEDASTGVATTSERPANDQRTTSEEYPPLVSEEQTTEEGEAVEAGKPEAKPVEEAQAKQDALAKLQEQEDEAAQEGPHAPAQITVETPEGGADLVADVVDPGKDVAARAHKSFLDKRIGDGEPVTIVRPDANHPQIAAAGALAQLFGKKSPKIVWFAGGNAGGYYSKARNTIYASIDMAHLKDGPLYSVIAHELTHFLELKHGGTFAALRAAIKSNPELFEAAKAAYLADAEASLPKVAALLSEDTDKARAALDSEGFAMVVMKAVQSGNFLAQLQDHPSLYQKVMDALAEFLMVMRIAPGLAERRYYKAVSLAFVNARTLEAKAKGKAKAKAKGQAKARAPGITAVSASEASAHTFKTGEPVALEAFHGVAKGRFEEEVFDVNLHGTTDAGYYAAGTHFTPDKQLADNYAGEGSPQQESPPHTYHVTLTLNNPYVQADAVAAIDKEINDLFEVQRKAISTDREAGPDAFHRALVTITTKVLKEHGYDGMIVKNIAGLEYVAFNSDSIQIHGLRPKGKATAKGKAKATGKPEESAASLAAEYDAVPERKANPNIYDAVDEADIAAAEEELADAQLFLDERTKQLSNLAFNNKLTPADRKELGTIAEHAATLKKHRGSSMEDRVARKEAATRLLALVDALLLKKAQDIVAVHPTWIINDIFQKGRMELWRLLVRKRKVGKTYAELAEDRAARKRGELDPKTAGAKIQHVWWIMGYKVKGAPFKSYLLDSSSPVITAMRGRKEEAGEKKEISLEPETDARTAKDPRKEIFTDKVASLWLSYKERGLSPEQSMAELEVDILKLAEEEGVGRDDLADFFLPKPAPKAHELDGLDPDVLRAALKAALLTKPGSTAMGRPELSMSTPPAMQAVDTAREQAGLPRPKTFDQWNAEGEAIVSDPAAKQALIAKVNRRAVLTPGETRAMENAIIPEMNDKITRAMLSGNITPGQLTKEEMLLNNYRYTGTEAGDILVSRRDPSETPAQRRLTLGGRAKVAAAGLQATPPGNITRDLEAAGLGGEGGKRPGGKLTAKQESATEALAAWHKDIQDMFARWAAAGINYRDMDKAIDKDPKKLRRVMLDITRIGEIHSEPGYFDAWVEHIRIAVLSGTLTHVRNLSGAIYGLGDILFFQPVASIVFRGEGFRPTLKSWEQVVSARVWAQMVSNAWFSWINDGHNMFLMQHPGYFSNKSNEQLEEQHAPGITGRGTARMVGKVAGKAFGKKAGKKLGQIAALPVKAYGRAGRAISLAFMVAGDQLMTTMHATANVAGYAVVKAKKAGLKPGTQEHTDFVDGQILDPNSASWRDSGLNGETAIATFRDEAGWVEAKFQKWRRKFPPLNLLAPVVKFPFKLPRRLAGLLPTAGVYIAYRAARAQITSKKFRKDYSYREFSQDMAKWVIGAGLYVWFDAMDFADDDKKEGWRVTGPPQTLPKTSGQFQTEAEIIPPYSFWHIDENGVKSQPRNYRNIEPLSSVIATYVVYVDAIRDAKKGRMDKLDVAMKAYSRIQNMVAEIPTMQAIKQFVRVTDNPAGYWGIDFAGGVMNMHVWNAVRASEASTNDLVRTKRIRPGEDKVAALLKLSLYNVPFAEKMPPKVGIFGDDVKVLPSEFATTLETMAPDIFDAVTLTRLFVPMRPYFRHTGNQGAMLEMLIDWDIDHPYDQRWITEPSDMVEVYMGEGYYKQPEVGLNNAEYYLYKKAAQTQFGILVEDVTWPEVATPGDLKLVEKMLEKSREGPLKLIKAAAQAKIDGDMDEYAKMLAELSDLAGL